MMHKACSIIEEVPYCFSMSSVKFQGHTGQKIIDFDPNFAFPDCNSCLNSPMAWSNTVEVPYCFSMSSIKSRSCGPKKIDDLIPVWVGLLDRSQLSNPSDLPCFYLHILSGSITLMNNHTPWYSLSCDFSSILFPNSQLYTHCLNSSSVELALSNSTLLFIRF